MTDSAITRRKTVYDNSDSFGKLLDACNEHDVEDPAFGPPELWPHWTDCVAARLGGPMTREECFSDESGYQPEPEDFAALDVLVDLDHQCAVENWEEYSAWDRWHERVFDLPEDF
jgi:hypothetical protein